MFLDVQLDPISLCQAFCPLQISFLSMIKKVNPVKLQFVTMAAIQLHRLEDLLRQEAPLTNISCDTVDGRNPAPAEVGNLSHYLQGFLHPRWLFGISEPSTVSHAPNSLAKNLQMSRGSRGVME